MKFTKREVQLINTLGEKVFTVEGECLERVCVHRCVNDAKEYALSLINTGIQVTNTVKLRVEKPKRSIKKLALAIEQQVTADLDNASYKDIQLSIAFQLNILVNQLKAGHTLDVTNDTAGGITELQKHIALTNKMQVGWLQQPMKSTYLQPCLFRDKLAVVLMHSTYYKDTKTDVLDGLSYLVLQNFTLTWVRWDKIEFLNKD